MPSEDIRKRTGQGNQQSQEERRHRERRQNEELREHERRRTQRRQTGLEDQEKKETDPAKQRPESLAGQRALEESTQPRATMRMIFHPFDHLRNIRNQETGEETGARDFDVPQRFPVINEPNSPEERFDQSQHRAFRKGQAGRRHYGLGVAGAGWLLAFLLIIIVLVTAAIVVLVYAL